MTGATNALPSVRAIRSDSILTRALCLPSAMCGPFCSVPPIGRIIVVFPAWTSARSSGHVSSSRKTVSSGSPKVGATMTLRRQRTVAHTLMSLFYTLSGHAEPTTQGRPARCGGLARQGVGSVLDPRLRHVDGVVIGIQRGVERQVEQCHHVVCVEPSAFEAHQSSGIPTIAVCFIGSRLDLPPFVLGHTHGPSSYASVHICISAHRLGVG